MESIFKSGACDFIILRVERTRKSPPGGMIILHLEAGLPFRVDLLPDHVA